MAGQPPLSITPGRGSEAQGVVYRGMDGRAFRARLKEVLASLPPPPGNLTPPTSLLHPTRTPICPHSRTPDPPLPASIPPSWHLNPAYPPTQPTVPPPYPPKVAGDAGVDVVVDMVGGELLEPCVRSLNWSGRAVVIGFASGSIPKV